MASCDDQGLQELTPDLTDTAGTVQLVGVHAIDASSLSVDGFTAATGTVYKGTRFRFATTSTDRGYYKVAADATITGNAATLTIEPVVTKPVVKYLREEHPDNDPIFEFFDEQRELVSIDRRAVGESARRATHPNAGDLASGANRKDQVKFKATQTIRYIYRHASLNLALKLVADNSAWILGPDLTTDEDVQVTPSGQIAFDVSYPVVDNIESDWFCVDDFKTTTESSVVVASPCANTGDPFPWP